MNKYSTTIDLLSRDEQISLFVIACKPGVRVLIPQQLLCHGSNRNRNALIDAGRASSDHLYRLMGKQFRSWGQFLQGFGEKSAGVKLASLHRARYLGLHALQGRQRARRLPLGGKQALWAGTSEEGGQRTGCVPLRGGQMSVNTCIFKAWARTPLLAKRC
jgi:hypothetical protein